ncbi:MAG: hypothetical protein CM1200mP7_2020 [Chloroflexota bacterium]|nr:MAG: hypothetical protein CM1200mP7_2020 [Chloroflexota bacterium]
MIYYERIRWIKKPMITDTKSWDKIPDIYDRLDKEEQDIAGVLVKWQ